MDEEQFKGSWQQFKGEVKNKWGRLTDKDLFEVEGDYIKFLGIVQTKYGDRKAEGGIGPHSPGRGATGF